MSDFLTSLYQEIQNTPVVDLEKDIPKVLEGEKVLGEIGDMSKRIWSLHTALVEEGRKKMQDHAHFHADHLFEDNGHGDCENFYQEMGRLKRKTKLLKDLFWTSVQEEIGVEGKNLAVKSGWKIVEVEDDEDESIENMLIKTLFNL